MLSRLGSFLSAMTQRQHFESSLDEEVRFHLDAYADDLIRSGIPRAEAMRRARLRFGSVERAKDDCRRARGLRLGDELLACWSDTRAGIRALARTPGFAVAAILTLALAVGINTAIYALIDAVLFRPLLGCRPGGRAGCALHRPRGHAGGGVPGSVLPGLCPLWRAGADGCAGGVPADGADGIRPFVPDARHRRSRVAELLLGSWNPTRRGAAVRCGHGHRRPRAGDQPPTLARTIRRAPGRARADARRQRRPVLDHGRRSARIPRLPDRLVR